jgi:hypothetical protein
MRPPGPGSVPSRTLALRLIAAGLLLFAQILGAALAGASAGGPSPLELCVGRGGTALVAVDPDAPDPDAPGHHDLCAGCLVGCCRASLPCLAGLEPWLAALPAQGRASALAEVPVPPAPRALRPPGRAPPAVS